MISASRRPYGARRFGHTEMRIHGIKPGDLRVGEEFQFTNKPTSAAASTFAAVLPDELRVTRYASELFGLPDETPVLAHWHGNWRTDAYATTVGQLKAKAGAVMKPQPAR
jgi:hypothetical protein